MRRHKYTLEEVKNIALQKEGSCLSTIYQNNKINLKWFCKKCSNTVIEFDGIQHFKINGIYSLNNEILQKTQNHDSKKYEYIINNLSTTFLVFLTGVGK